MGIPSALSITLAVISLSTVLVSYAGLTFVQNTHLKQPDTMVNPGAFQGLRKQFLMNEKPAYTAGVQGGFAADALANIQRRYFRRFPIDLPHDQEPTVEWLAAVNDNAPDTELEITGTDKLTSVEFEEAVAQLKERRKLVKYRKAVSTCCRAHVTSLLTSDTADQTLDAISVHQRP